MAEKQARSSGRDEYSFTGHFAHRLREGLLILTIAFSLFVLLALVTYHRNDPSFTAFVSGDHIKNAAGRVGAWVADLFLFLSGFVAYLFPVLMSYAAWIFYRNGRYEYEVDEEARTIGLIVLRSLGFLFILGSACGLISLHLKAAGLHLPFNSGGLIGFYVGSSMLHTFNKVGTTLILLAVFCIGVTLFSGLSWFTLVEALGGQVIRLWQWVQDTFIETDWKTWFRELPQKMIPGRAKREAKHAQIIQVKEEKKEKAAGLLSLAKTALTKHKEKPEAPSVTEEKPPFEAKLAKAAKRKPRRSSSSAIPDVSLLDAPEKSKNVSASPAELQARSREVEECLKDFGVAVKVVAVYPGPVVTRFELELAAGTKVSKISGLAKDLARSLSVISVRVVEVIPGKSVVGIELPNKNREIVTLQEVIASKTYKETKAALPLALGKDIAGHPVVVDLAKMPHLLVAGTTGSGKSVSVNAMLMSFLYHATPEDLRLIMIDPKMLELSVYDGIPHLLTPVVTDMKDAAQALRWCVIEMERRYRLMASLGVRNLAGFNTKVREAKANGKKLYDPMQPKNADPVELETLPLIVVIADEFADMMVVVGKKVETLIARLAQKARAAGIHLIMATQRPSVDVITGLIKANIPTRIAFQVSSKIDSRTILDQQGAEQLLGHGDMLYLAPGAGVPKRVHGAFVDDDEVHRVVAYLKESGEPDYLEDVIADAPSSSDLSGFTDAVMGDGDSEGDELYDQAVEFITKARRVSVSSVQRRFKIGYNRASRIVEAMEAAGVVSSMEGNGQREVLAPPPPEDH